MYLIDKTIIINVVMKLYATFATQTVATVVTKGGLNLKFQGGQNL